MRDHLIKEETTTLFLNDEGNVMLRPTFDEIWYHLVDHSRYHGLNVMLHSMRIGGATVRHAQGMDTKEIMRLGRWTDDTINKYIRPEYLCDPSKLQGIKDLKTKRKYKVYSMCECKIKHKYQPNRKSLTRWRKEGVSDTKILKRMEKVAWTKFHSGEGQTSKFRSR